MNENLLLPSLRHQKGEQKFKVSYESGLLGDDHKLADIAKTHEAGLILTKEYPDHYWQVRASHKQGTIEIRLPMFSAYPYVIHLDKVTSPNDLKDKVIKAGGAFLEIFLMPRGEFKEDRFKESLLKIKRHGAGFEKIDPTKLSGTLDAEEYVAGKLREIGIGVEG